MIYVLFGDDEFSRDQRLAAMKAALGDPATASMNMTTLEGDRMTLPQIQENADAMPFLSDRRLVVVRHFLDRFEPRRDPGEPAQAPVANKQDKALAESLQAYLPGLPDTTDLIFVEDRYSDKSPLYQAIATAKGRVEQFAAPRGQALQAWVVKQAGADGGRITPAAAALLAVYVGDNLRQLGHELEKLLAYTDRARSIEERDVQLLVTETKEGTIFQLVDAVAGRNGKRAVELFHTLLGAGQSPIYILAMITRQFRMLLQVKELSQAGSSQPAIQAALQMHPFVLGKVSDQARGFSLERLDAIYRQLAEVDTAIKRGRMEPEVALDLLLADLTA